MAVASKLNPLAWNVAIVDKSGNPTQEFMLKWARQQNVNAAIPVVKAGAGIAVTGSGDVTVSLTNTGVAATTYGDATHVSQVTVDAQGRVTAAANVAIASGSVTYDWNVDDAWMSGLYVHVTDGQSITGLHNSGADSAIRAYVSHATGKFYFEFLVNLVDSHWPITGVGSAAATLGSFVGSDVNGWAMAMTTGVSWHNNATSPQNTYANGDVLGVAVDFTATTGSIKFFKNNVAQTTAYTGLTLGAMFPMTSMRGSANNPKGRLRLRAADQSYSPPAGYSPWV